MYSQIQSSLEFSLQTEIFLFMMRGCTQNILRSSTIYGFSLVAEAYERNVDSDSARKRVETITL